MLKLRFDLYITFLVCIYNGRAHGQMRKRSRDWREKKKKICLLPSPPPPSFSVWSLVQLFRGRTSYFTNHKRNKSQEKKTPATQAYNVPETKSRSLTMLTTEKILEGGTTLRWVTHKLCDCFYLKCCVL